MRKRLRWRDQSGKKIANWNVLSRKGCSSPTKYLCQCGCGRISVVTSGNLLNGGSTQCLSCARTTHGMSIGSRIYETWESMLSRCRDARHSSYRYYGGRGIKVRDRWHKFENFLADMGEKPLGLEIDRINNDGHYEPGNCRWVTRKENDINREEKRTKLGRYDYVRSY